MKYNSKIKGAATLELLIAFAILALNITAIMLLISGGQSIYIDSELGSEAASKAREVVEATKAQAEEDFNLVNSYNSTVVSGGVTFNKSLSVEDGPDVFTKLITSTVSWSAIGGRNLESTIKTLLTNKEAAAGGDTCSSVLSGDWTDPQIDSYEFGAEILGDTSSGFPITSVLAFNKKMYVTVSNVNGNNDETFFILDIASTGVMPAVLGKFDNSPGTISEGLKAVAIDGANYAYVANAYDSAPAACTENHNCAQLQVIDISNPNSPAVIKNKKLSSFTPSNRLANGTSIFYKNGVVYLGLANAVTGPELYILDVGGAGAGTPTNPIILASIEIGNGVNSIHVRNNYLYIASPNTQELKIYDVSNPGSPQIAGFYNSPSGAGNGKSMYLVGSKLYLGKTVPNAGNDFHILNNANPGASLPQLGGLNTAASINGIVIRDYLGFFITSDGEFQVWRIDNPSSIAQYASPITLPPGSGGGLSGTATDCEGNYFYVGSESSNNKGYISVITGA